MQGSFASNFHLAIIYICIFYKVTESKKTMKKIRFNGIICHKFELAHLIDKISPLCCAWAIYEHLTYAELADMLYRACQRHNDYNHFKHLIDWGDYPVPF